MDTRTERRVHILTLALGIAVMPPLWAIIAPSLGINCGSVALICAGLYVANGNKRDNAFKILIGFLLGDLWALLALWAMSVLSLPDKVELYVVLFVLGALAVLIGESLCRWIFTPSWLCGWAIALTVLGTLPMAKLGSPALQIAVSMAVGVLYVGVGVDAVQQFLLRKLARRGIPDRQDRN